MALIEQIENLKQQGMSESQIINSLKEKGISPKQISEALGQSKIKSAIYPVGSSTNEEDNPEFKDMQPSVMQSPTESQTQVPQQNAQFQAQMPMQQPYSQEQYAYPQGQEQYAYPQGQEQYAYDPNQQGYYQSGIDIETVRDVSKQEIEEATKKIKEQIELLTKLKTELKFEVQNIDNRLSKIEAVMQELQTAIIRKMGEYGEAISGISEEVKATQSSFSKMINPVLDKKRNLSQKSEEDYSNEQENQEQQDENTPKKGKKGKSISNKDSEQSRDKKGSATFEDYFR